MENWKGTKGEWHTVEKHRVIYVENKDKVLVAELDNHQVLGFNQATPTAVYFNAKLIASAPELLEACKIGLEAIRELHSFQDGWEEEDEIISKAINKAIK